MNYADVKVGQRVIVNEVAWDDASDSLQRTGLVFAATVKWAGFSAVEVRRQDGTAVSVHPWQLDQDA